VRCFLGRRSGGNGKDVFTGKNVDAVAGGGRHRVRSGELSEGGEDEAVVAVVEAGQTDALAAEAELHGGMNVSAQ
jgi:hypothetical protein